MRSPSPVRFHAETSARRRRELDPFEKTAIVLQHLRELRLHLDEFIQIAYRQRRYKGQLRQLLNNDVFMDSILPDRRKNKPYRKELIALADSKYSGKWTTEEMNRQMMNDRITAIDFVDDIELLRSCSNYFTSLSNREVIPRLGFVTTCNRESVESRYLLYYATRFCLATAIDGLQCEAYNCMLKEPKNMLLLA